MLRCLSQVHGGGVAVYIHGSDAYNALLCASAHTELVVVSLLIVTEEIKQGLKFLQKNNKEVEMLK